MNDEEQRDSEPRKERLTFEEILAGVSSSEMLSWMPDRGRRRSVDEFDVEMPEPEPPQDDNLDDVSAVSQDEMEEPDMSMRYDADYDYGLPGEPPARPLDAVEDAWGNDVYHCAADLPMWDGLDTEHETSLWVSQQREGAVYDYVSDGQGGFEIIDEHSSFKLWPMISRNQDVSSELVDRTDEAPLVVEEKDAEPQIIVPTRRRIRRWVLPTVAAVLTLGAVGAGGVYLSGILEVGAPEGLASEVVAPVAVQTATIAVPLSSEVAQETEPTPRPIPVVEKMLQQRTEQQPVESGAAPTVQAPAMVFPTPAAVTPAATAPRPDALFADVDIITIGFDSVVVLTGKVYLTTDDGRRLNMSNESAARAKSGATMLDFVRPEGAVLVVTGFFRDGAESGLRSSDGVEADYAIPPTVVREKSIERFVRDADEQTAPEAELPIVEIADVDVEFDSFLIRLRHLIPNREYRVSITVPEGVVGCPEKLRNFVVRTGEKQTDMVHVEGFLSTCFEVPYTADVVVSLDGAVIAKTELPAPSLLVASNQRESELLVDEAKQIMLAHINEYRDEAGVSLLKLSDLEVAQRHAELSLAECVFSHWDVYGLKPYMRYSLTGGIQASAENWIGTTSFCIDEHDGGGSRFDSRKEAVSELAESVVSWYESEAHRENLLDPYFSEVAIGVAWDGFNWRAAAMFIGSHIEEHDLGLARLSPDGELAVWGRVVSEADFREYGVVRVYFDPQPVPLTRGQLARTYCYEIGRQVAEIVPALEDERVGPVEFSNPTSACPDPYLYASDIEAPSNEAEGIMLFKAAAHRHSEGVIVESSLPALRYAATEWQPTTEASARFSVKADVASMLSVACDDERCPGIYTVEVWGTDRNRAAVLLASQSLWVGIDPPAAAVKAYAE